MMGRGRPQFLNPVALPAPQGQAPTSFFCSIAWCMILASFFFSRSRMDGDSDWFSMFGNFLPKTRAREDCGF